MLNFAVVMWVLNKFLYQPIIKTLNERASKIKDGMEAAEENLKAQDEIEKSKKLAMAEARKDATEVVDTAKKEAKALIAAAKVEAKADAQRIVEKEREAVQADMQKQKADFEKKAANLVSQAVEAVLRDSLDLKLQQKLVNDQITKLSAKHLQ